LEEEPESRGVYSVAKRRTEDVALTHLKDSTAPWTILRPSLIVGQGHDPFAPVGAKIGNTVVCLGRPRKRLLLVHVEDVSAAVLRLIQNKDTAGGVYNLSHDPITVQEYVDGYLRRGGAQRVWVLYIPYFVARIGSLAGTLLQKLTHMGPSINRVRLLSFYRDLSVTSTLLRKQTGWQPAGPLLECLRREKDMRLPTDEWLSAASTAKAEASDMRNDRG
jgi:nucleoside-diphosphate-sugar epimerase